MSNITYGEITWDAELPKTGKFTSSKDLFLRLNEGPNELRLITSPFQYMSHTYKSPNAGPKDFGQKIMCSITHGSCPLCEAGNKAKTRWLLGVIERATGTYKVLDVSYAVYSQIKSFSQSRSWGIPTAYDINIVRDSKSPSPANYYKAMPLPKEPLSVEDQKIRDSVDLDDLKRRVTPLTPDAVRERMAKIDSYAAGGSTATAAPRSSPVSTTQQGEVKVPDTLADDDEDFPDFG